MGSLILNAALKYIEANPAVLEEVVNALFTKLLAELKSHNAAQATAAKG